MRLTPSLGLGFKRIARRPVESLILILAVALGSLGSLIALDVFLVLRAQEIAYRTYPGNRRVSIFNQDTNKSVAIRSYESHELITKRLQVRTDYRDWLEAVRPRLPDGTVGYFTFYSHVQVQLSDDQEWLPIRNSLCADVEAFAMPEVDFIAGRAFTREEFDAGAPLVIVGELLAEELFPGVSPQDLIGKEINLMPYAWHEEPRFRARILGITRGPDPSTWPDWQGPANWFCVTKSYTADGGGPVFLVRDASQVPGLERLLRTLLDEDPELKYLSVHQRYDLYLATRRLTSIMGVLAFTIGVGTLLIALWTMSSLFAARLPSMQRSLRTLSALGANETHLRRLALSELVPLSLGGAILGIGLHLMVRWLRGGDSAFLPSDLWSTPLVLALAAGLQYAQVRPLIGRAVRSAREQER